MELQIEKYYKNDGSIIIIYGSGKNYFNIETFEDNCEKNFVGEKNG